MFYKESMDDPQQQLMRRLQNGAWQMCLSQDSMREICKSLDPRQMAMYINLYYIYKLYFNPGSGLLIFRPAEILILPSRISNNIPFREMLLRAVGSLSFYGQPNHNFCQVKVEKLYYYPEHAVLIKSIHKIKQHAEISFLNKLQRQSTNRIGNQRVSSTRHLN